MLKEELEDALRKLNLVKEEVEDTLQKLIVARSLIDTPEKWTSAGWGKLPRICLAHALCIANEGKIFDVVDGGLPQKLLQNLIGGRYIGAFNDTHTHEEVLELVDRGIAVLRSI